MVPAHMSARSDYAAAEARIAETIASGAKVIDFDGLRHLRRIPPQIAEIADLQRADFGDTQISSLDPLAGATALSYLSLAGTRVADLSPLTGAQGLKSLNIANTWVTDIAPLAELPALERLDMPNTSILSLEPATRIAQLSWINLHGSYARDGSRVHFDRLQDTVTSVQNGSAYRQDYRPGPAYLRKLRVDRLALRLDLPAPFGVR